MQACSCLTMVVRAVLLLAIAVAPKSAAACVACGWLVGCIALRRSIAAVLVARHGSCIVGCLGHVGCWVLGSSILGHVGILRHPWRHSTRRPILHLHGSEYWDQQCMHTTQTAEAWSLCAAKQVSSWMLS